MKKLKHPVGFYTFSAIYLLSIYAIESWIDRTQSIPLLLAFCTTFIGYIFLLQEKEFVKVLIGIGVLARLLMFFSMPSLSDDIYRFIWDGTLFKNGIHPFAELPEIYLNQNIEGINLELFNLLNSPNYFTIYPPLNQFIFWVSVSFGSSWLLSVNIIRSILLVADIGSFLALRKLLKRYGKSANLAFWFFLNPLVILEFTGNVHFEGLVIFFLLMGIYFLETRKHWFASTSVGLGVGTKLLPLIFLPFLLFNGIKNKTWWVAILAGVIGLITVIPMLNQTFLEGIQSSLDLYFRKFEFNASFYFIAREIGEWFYGYNKIAQIGPLLSTVSLLSILAIAIQGTRKNWSLPTTFLFTLSIYLLFTTTVHPWYILPLVSFGILAGYWYPVVWSFSIFLTYLGYSSSGFELPMWIVVIEYLLVGLTFALDLKLKRSNSD